MNSQAEKNPPSPLGNTACTLAICGLIALGVLAVFAQTARYEFINLDDDLNIYNNPHVTAGVTLQGLKWAFLHPSGTDYWRPLCFLTHMLDCQFFGLWAGGHHLVNVLIHAAAAVTLFLVLRGMTGRMWPSAVVAAVFAIHPLRVESVAWVTERKDVLAALFFMLTLGAYLHYVRRPTLGRYAAAVGVYAAGLMCKATLIPLPLVLVLLDYWPLGRGQRVDTETRRRGDAGTGGIGAGDRGSGFHPLSFIPHPSSFKGWGALLLEKVPFVALSAASCVICLSTGGSVTEVTAEIPPWIRMAWAMNSAITYLAAFFWPAALLPWYQDPQGQPAVWPAALAIIGISAAVFALRRRAPWLLTGWFWYVAMLLPTVTMSQARIDRFTYLSQIGVCVALTWLCADLAARWRVARMVPALASAGVIAALAIAANGLCAHWRDSPTLWNYVLDCEPRNLLAHFNLAHVLASRGRIDESIPEYQKALEIKPDYADAHINLGNALCNRGQVDAAIEHYRLAVQISPREAGAYHDLGMALFRLGRTDEAIAALRAAVKIKPDYLEALNNLGGVLAVARRTDEAMVYYRQALEIDPDNVQVLSNLGDALAGSGRVREALDYYRRAMELAAARNDRASVDVIERRIRRAQAAAEVDKRGR